MKWRRSIALTGLALLLLWVVTAQLGPKFPLGNAGESGESIPSADSAAVAFEEMRSSAWLEEGPVAGAMAPDFALKGLDGHTYRLSELAGKKPVVINFWASWCPPCKEEAPDLVRLYGKYGERLEIYAVNLTSSDTAASAELFVQRYGFRFPVLLDEEGRVGEMYQPFSIPTSYFIDRSGRIQNKLLGITSPEELEKLFTNLVNSSD